MAKDDVKENDDPNDDDAGEDEDEDEDEAEEEESAPAAKATKEAFSPVPLGVPPSPEADDVIPEPRVRDIRPVVPPPPAASLGKSVTAFMGVLLLLSAGFWFLGGNDPFGASGAAKWKAGQTVPVDITLDPRDDMKLACAADANIGGKHCEYKTKSDKYDGTLEDKTMLRPYTTTSNDQFLAAGLWSHDDLSPAKRPKDRFTVKCDFKIDGKVTSPAVRWDVIGNWNDREGEWWAGSLTNCHVQK